MTKEQLENYAHVLISTYAPRGKEAANYELKNHIDDRKLHELTELILDFPKDIDPAVKEEVADMAKQKLVAIYKSFNK